MAPSWAQNRFKIASGADFASDLDFEPSLDRFWIDFGPTLDRSGADFGTILGRFLVELRIDFDRAEEDP